MRVLHDRVLLRPILPPDEVGGLHIPEAAREVPQEAIVVQMGEGVLGEFAASVGPFPLSSGARVMYAKHVGTPVKIEGEELLLVKFSDILLVMDD